MKINPAPLHLAQTVITGLVVAMSICILGTAAHTLDVFNKQQSINPWWLPLWHDHFDVHGTKALIASAVVTFVFSAVFLIMSIIPKFNLPSKPTLRALLALGSSAPSAVLCLATIIYAHILNNDAPELDTIQTWTCKYKNGRALQQNLAPGSSMGNGNFGSLCMESKFALYGTLVIFLLLVGSSGLGVLSWCADKWASRQERKEMESVS
ncbi:hypothetical protein CC80DRAFT_483503 [Byssothecium circinans]|uniref:MARVEL domain-containing protein n=1 Tax=Byssothecium circinans TaxID=147558 RepID=A0A6A5TBW8_9PLEO|nr:hypothetical protein CC80DRAFT_483503 [Byssothecium circinans]